MFRILFAIGMFICLHFPLFSQNSVKWGPTYERKGGISGLVTSDETQFYAIGGSNDKPSFLTFNFSGKLVTEKPINLAVDGAKEMEFYDIVHTAGHDYIVFLNRDKKLNKSAFYYTEVKNGALAPLTKSFHAFPFAYTYGSGLGPAVAYDEEAVSGSFRVSPDKKTIVTFGSDIGHNADQIIEVRVFNENLEQSWAKSHSIKVENRQMEVLELAVNNKGDVFVLTKKWAKLNDRYMGDKPVEHILYAFTAAGVKEYQLKLDKAVQPVGVTVQIGSNGEVAVLGTYRTLELKSNYVLGTFCGLINESGSLSAKTFPFSSEVLTALNHTSTETKTNSLSEVVILDGGVLPNGHFYFAAKKATYGSTSSGVNSWVTAIGQMLVSFGTRGESVRVDYTKQPIFVKNVFGPDDVYTYQKNNGVVFVANYVKLGVEDKGFKDAPVYTSECYLEPSQASQCTDFSVNTADKEFFVFPTYQLLLKDGKHVIMRGKGMFGDIYSFGVY